MRRLGYASLPIGRLFEGHVNAAQLVGLYGGKALHRACVDEVRRGALLGVWGADGEAPVLAQAAGEGFILSGSKIFCSGLGVVQTALISAGLDGRTQLFAVDVKDAARADLGQWDVSGMRATPVGRL